MKSSLQLANILDANQFHCANYGNFNLIHRINIEGEGTGGWEGGFAKNVITQFKSGSILENYPILHTL